MMFIETLAALVIGAMCVLPGCGSGGSGSPGPDDGGLAASDAPGSDIDSASTSPEPDSATIGDATTTEVGTGPCAGNPVVLAYVRASDALVARSAEIESSFMNVCNAINKDVGDPIGASASEACATVHTRIQKLYADGGTFSINVSPPCSIDGSIETSCRSPCSIASICGPACNGLAAAGTTCPKPTTTVSVMGDVPLESAFNAHGGDFGAALNAVLLVARPTTALDSVPLTDFPSVEKGLLACVVNAKTKLGEARVHVNVAITASAIGAP